MTTSIISHETEINFLNTNIAKNKKIFISGIFGNVLKDKYKIKNTFIVPGEPENFFLNLNLDKNELDGFFNGDQKTQINNYVDNLDDLPFPDWSYYLKKYPLKIIFWVTIKKTYPILASRGCPYSCFNYCTYPLQQGRKVRYRSPKNVVDEINSILKK